MNIRDKYKKYSLEYLMYFFFGIYMLTLILNMTNVVYSSDACKLFVKIVRYFCYAIFIYKIFYDLKKGSKITIVILCMLILSLFIVIFANNKNILFLTLILVSVRNLDFNKLIDITLKIFFVCFFIVVSLSILGVIPDWTFGRGSVIRHSIGFIYATDAIGVYLSIILMYFYKRKSKATIYELILLETINIFLYDYTDGRTSFILVSMILLVMLLSKFKFIKRVFNGKVIQKIIKIASYSLPIILFIILHIIIFMYANNYGIAIEINKLLSSRIKYTYQAYENYQLTWFGQDIEWKRMGWIWLY